MIAIPRSWAGKLDIPLNVHRQDAIHPVLAEILQLKDEQQRAMVDLIRATRTDLITRLLDTASASERDDGVRVLHVPSPGSWLKPLIADYLAALQDIGDAEDLLLQISKDTLLLARVIPDQLHRYPDYGWVITIESKEARNKTTVEYLKDDSTPARKQSYINFPTEVFLQELAERLEGAHHPIPQQTTTVEDF